MTQRQPLFTQPARARRFDHGRVVVFKADPGGRWTPLDPVRVKSRQGVVLTDSFSCVVPMGVTGPDPRLRDTRSVWAVSSRERFLAADHALLHIPLP